MAKHKIHSCFLKASKRLEPLNTRLVTNILNPNQVVVATERIRDLRDGKKAAVLIASHCPFCGEILA